MLQSSFMTILLTLINHFKWVNEGHVSLLKLLLRSQLYLLMKEEAQKLWDRIDQAIKEHDQQPVNYWSLQSQKYCNSAQNHLFRTKVDWQLTSALWFAISRFWSQLYQANLWKLYCDYLAVLKIFRILLGPTPTNIS